MDSLTGLVFDIQRFSIHDGPGIRTTVFLKGCPLRCQWCHNPESQSATQELMVWSSRCSGCGACIPGCRQDAITLNGGPATTNTGRCTVCGSCVDICFNQAREIVGRSMTVAQAMAQIERDLPFYDESGGGVTFSGGEPLSQPEFLRAILAACREHDIRTTLDTCGFAPWQELDRVRSYVDLFLYDLKLMDDTRHRQVTGVSNQTILENLAALSRHGHRIVIRLPIIPGVNDDADNIHRAGEFAASLPHLERVDLLPYHHIALNKYDRTSRVYQLLDLSPPSEETVEEIAGILKHLGLDVRTGG